MVILFLLYDLDRASGRDIHSCPLNRRFRTELPYSNHETECDAKNVYNIYDKKNVLRILHFTDNCP